MTLQVWFWVIYVIAIIFSLYNAGVPGLRAWAGNYLVLFILIGILGLAAFGSPVKG